MSFLKKVFIAKPKSPSKAIVSRPNVSENPAVQAGDLDHYIVERVSHQRSIDLHSAFQLKFESARIGRNAYRQPAWGHKLYTRQLYELFMLCLTARALGCSDQMAAAEKWFADDIPLLNEHLPHHFADQVRRGRDLLYDSDSLGLLSKLRSEKDKQDYDLGPFHFQVFPYHFTPEKELLAPGSCPEFNRNIPLDSEVEAILVELLTGVWR